MTENIVRAGLLAVVLAGLTGCGATGKYVPTNLTQDELQRVKSGNLVRLTQVLPESGRETLVLTPATYTNGVYVCAIENLSKPCLPKLSMLVSEQLTKRGIAVVADRNLADAVLYFETWFDSYSSHSDGVKLLSTNPTVAGTSFASKMEQSLETGNPPDVHKHFRVAIDPFSLVAINSNDDQKFIYVAMTAVEMKDATRYPGDGNKLAASDNPWVKAGKQPAARTLIGNYDGNTPTEQAVTPMLQDAIELLVERAGQPQKKM